MPLNIQAGVSPHAEEGRLDSVVQSTHIERPRGEEWAR